jgi:hypothetical protein
VTDPDWLREYEEAVASLPPARPIAEWSLEEARAAARDGFELGRAMIERDAELSEARVEARAAVTERRLAGIRKRRPELAARIESDLEWLAHHHAGFAGRPFREKIAYWYWLFTLDSADDEGFLDFQIARERGLPRVRPERTGASRRGTSATWPGLREAAFTLLRWRAAVGGPRVTVRWLADELRLIDPNLTRPDPRGGEPDMRQARRLLREWRAANHTELGKS